MSITLDKEYKKHYLCKKADQIMYGLLGIIICVLRLEWLNTTPIRKGSQWNLKSWVLCNGLLSTLVGFLKLKYASGSLNMLMDIDKFNIISCNCIKQNLS